MQSSLLISDQSGAAIYVGSANGGIWKTSDAGRSWTPGDGAASLPEPDDEVLVAFANGDTAQALARRAVSGGMNVVLCDGSVRFLKFVEALRALGAAQATIFGQTASRSQALVARLAALRVFVPVGAVGPQLFPGAPATVVFSRAGAATDFAALGRIVGAVGPESPVYRHRVGAVGPESPVYGRMKKVGSLNTEKLV